MKIEELAKQLLPYLNGTISVTGAPVSGYAPSPHTLDSNHHTGIITDAQHGVRTLVNAHAHSALSGVTASQHHVQTSITAGNGLTGGGAGAGVTLAVGVSGLGLSVGADAVVLASSSNPGAAASILASDASGYLQLTRLGLGVSPDYPLHVVGASRMDGDLTFVGAQSILTTSDNLTLAPAADLVLTPGGTARVMASSGVRLQSDNYASQTTGWGISYAGSGDFRYLYADELHARSFITDLEQALAGGQIICKSVAPLASVFTVPAADGWFTTMWVESFKGFENAHVFADGDIVRLRQFNRSRGAVNLLSNPSFETNLIGWSAVTLLPGTTWVRDENTAYQSQCSGKGTFDGAHAVEGVQTSIAVTSGVTYTASLYIKISSVSDIQMDVVAPGGESGNIAINGTADWTRYSWSFTSSADGTANLRVFSDQTATGTFWIDNAQVEVSATVTDYCDGSLDIANCWGRVYWQETDTTTKFQRYSFQRWSAGGEGAAIAGSAVGIGTLALDYGTGAGGFLESNAIDGVNGEYAPYHQVVTWTTTPAYGSIVRTRLGNLKGIFNVANEYGLYAGAGILDASLYLRISDQAAELHNISLKMFDGAVNTVLISPTAPSFAMGSTLPTAYGTGTGIWMGKDTAYKFRVGDPAGTRLQWTGTALEIYDAKFTMSGASSAIAIGTTPPTSASAGTGIWIDRTGMYGLAANVVQAKFDATTGAITAGAGNVALNVNGINIAASTRPQVLNSYKFFDPGTLNIVSVIYGFYLNTDNNVINVVANPMSGTDSEVDLTAYAPAGNEAHSNITVQVTGKTARQIEIRQLADGTSSASIGADVTSIAGGLNVGSATGAGPGCISVSGVAALTTPAESWVGPSATAIHFQGGLISIGTITAYANASLTLLGGGAGGVTVAFSNAAVALPGGLSLKTGYGVGYLACQNAAGNAGAPLYSQSMNLFYSRAAGVVHFDDPSDATLKKNIKSLPSGALSKINALKPRMYQMRAGANHHRKDDHTRQLTGWIADEFEQVFPDAVSHDDVGNFKSLNTSCIHEWTVAAIQELSAKVDVLEARAKSKVS
jgi:hypothetical protein